MSEKKRGFLDRLTNRDLLERQGEIISTQTVKLKKLESVITTAIDGKTVSDLKGAYDSYVEGAALRLPITDMGKGAKFGETIIDSNRLFASEREPIGYRMVTSVAEDIWDNWFKVVDAKKEKGDAELDSKAQTMLNLLNAKQTFVRATIFARRYGWSIVVVAYDDGSELDKPLPENLKGLQIRMIEPYPKTRIMEVITVTESDIEAQQGKEKPDEPPERLGMPRYYIVDRTGEGASAGTKIHWSRIIHVAPRLDEHKWKGVSVIDSCYDDVTGFRNMRWGMYQTIFRFGSGFPVITLTGAKEKDVQRYYEEGKFKDICARTYLVKNENEEIEFKGAQGTALNPQPYYEAGIEQLSMGSRIPKAILRGAQAGSIAGSEVNQKEYSRYIGSEQSLVESLPHDLVRRLIETGQIKTTAERFIIEFVDPFTLGEREQMIIELTMSMIRKNQLNYMTVNEVRKLDDPEAVVLPEGNVILPLEQLKAKPQSGPAFSKAPFSSQFDFASQSPLFPEQLLEDEFRKIWGKVSRGDVSREEAINEASTVLEQFIQKSEDYAIKHLEAMTGHRVETESPEAKILRTEERTYYLEWFSKILDDIIKKREEFSG